ncbi:hypothetical protein [Caenimonas aquaedulcis]|uniref:Uncharacterized protein n=1 Tax=Caenimonas aquaedulcis TaxID=2793270 RepID=A0A931H8B5_9BURK|nr:hypothetical protein [Caenimonas aquaedulcis]MBG9390576.1 hypothetical protein [Caenimonas aquaedulcis]
MKKFLLASVLATVAASVQAASLTVGGGVFSATAYDYSGGAVCSLKVNGVEFIDAVDHGRCIQSAVSFDGMGEAFNPTEAGGYLDRVQVPAGGSSSIPLGNSSGPGVLSDTVKMAFWNAVNGQRTSNHILNKTVHFGYGGNPNAIEWKVSFTVPADEIHSVGQFEILTGYMNRYAFPGATTRFYTISTTTGRLSPLGDGPGEQSQPVIFATADGRNAVGVWSPQSLAGGGYGRWRYGFGLSKWNMVSRIDNPRGTYSFRVFVVMGTQAQVVSGLTQLYNTEPHS